MSDLVNVPQGRLDMWRAFAEQTRTDLMTLRLLVARGQTQAADQLLASMLEQTLIVGLSLDDAGANRPPGMRPRPSGADRRAAQEEAQE
jgi:hypothetical protein